MFGISILGWLHSAVCMIALPAGPLALTLTKGSPLHRKAGYLYAGSMVIGCVTALGLYAPITGLPRFNMFHWMSIATLAMVVFAVWAASRQRTRLGAYGHPVAMIASYYMLVGAAINEALARIPALRTLALTGTPGAQTIMQSNLLRMAQSTAMMVCLVLIAGFCVKVARQRSRRPVLAAAE